MDHRVDSAGFDLSLPHNFAMKRLFIIAGCNGAGKTTASFTILPEVLDCDEFVNADEIARGLSPFNPDKNSFQAGRLMLERISCLKSIGKGFAFETTLSTRSYKEFITEAKKEGYEDNLIFFYLNSGELAIKRVETRVMEGGHNIPKEVIRRRYEKGLKNFFSIFKPIVQNWIVVDNSEMKPTFIAKGNHEETIMDNDKWAFLKNRYDDER